MAVPFEQTFVMERIQGPPVALDRGGTGDEHVLAGQLVDEMRMLLEQPALQGVPLLPRHRRDVERISRLLVRPLLELSAVDEPDVAHGDRRGLAGVLVLEAATQGG